MGGALKANGVGSAGPAAAVAVGSPSSLVHNLFGLDVQVPAPVEDEASGQQQEGSQAGAAAGGDTGTGSKGRKKGAAAGDGVSPGGAAAGKGSAPAGSGGVIEVFQFMKFFHLVPAQALRMAYDMHFDASFGDVLLAADRITEQQHQAARGVTQGKAKWSTAATAAAAQVPLPSAAASRTVLLRQPRVFALAVVWESPQAPMESLQGTIDALGTQVELCKVFAGVPPGPLYQLRCVICYFGHHYQTFALSDELQQWMLFDDDFIKLIGDWNQVKKAMKASRLQPSLLFFERG